MADDPNSTTDGDTVDLEELVGNVLDARGLTKERIDGLGGLGDRIEALFAASKGSNGGNDGGSSQAASGFDEAGFMDKVGKLIDERLGAATAKKPKPLTRWLTGQ